MQNLLLARMSLMAGMTHDDVVHSANRHGMISGGHHVRETVTHWVGARFLSAGTGVEMRSAQHIFIMEQFGPTAIVGFADDSKRLA